MDDGQEREAVIENLKACGCDQGTIERYCACCDCGDARGRDRVLDRHRRELLEELHQCQEKVDRLDYLRNKNARENGNRENGKK